MIKFIGPVATRITFEPHRMESLQICTWQHYWQCNGKLFVILRLTAPICTGGLMFDEPWSVEWIYAR